MDKLGFNFGGKQEFWMILNTVLFLVTYRGLILSMFEKSHKRVQIIQESVKDWFKNRTPRPTNPHTTPFYILHICLGAFLKCIYYLYSSYVIDIFGNGAWFGLNVWGLIGDRAFGETMMAPGQNENLWGFGQVLPLLMVALPLLNALEIYCGTSGSCITKLWPIACSSAILPTQSNGRVHMQILQLLRGKSYLPEICCGYPWYFPLIHFLSFLRRTV